MDTGGDTDITKNRVRQKKIRITVRAPAVHHSIDIEAASSVQLKELRTVLAEWMSERTSGRYVNSKHSLLVRECNGEIMQSEQTLEDIGVNTNEIFYLF